MRQGSGKMGSPCEGKCDAFAWEEARVGGEGEGREGRLTPAFFFFLSFFVFLDQIICLYFSMTIIIVP